MYAVPVTFFLHLLLLPLFSTCSPSPHLNLHHVRTCTAQHRRSTGDSLHVRRCCCVHPCSVDTYTFTFALLLPGRKKVIFSEVLGSIPTRDHFFLTSFQSPLGPYFFFFKGDKPHRHFLFFWCFLLFLVFL